MEEIKDGGQAFPLVAQNWHHKGMTLRDYFAAKAMPAYWALSGNDREHMWIAAEWAYSVADAMLKERERR